MSKKDGDGSDLGFSEEMKDNLAKARKFKDSTKQVWTDEDFNRALDRCVVLAQKKVGEDERKARSLLWRLYYFIRDLLMR